MLSFIIYAGYKGYVHCRFISKSANAVYFFPCNNTFFIFRINCQRNRFFVKFTKFLSLISLFLNKCPPFRKWKNNTTDYEQTTQHKDIEIYPVEDNTMEALIGTVISILLVVILIIVYVCFRRRSKTVNPFVHSWKIFDKTQNHKY